MSAERYHDGERDYREPEKYELGDMETNVFLLIRGEYRDLLHQLFRREADGCVFFGGAHSRELLADLERLAEWTEFIDYLMEGSVRYSLRASDVPEGLVLAVQLNGTSRDRLVVTFLQKHIRAVGLEALLMADEPTA